MDGTDVLGRRVLAALIDLLVLTGLFVLLAVLIGDSDASDSSLSARLDGVGFLVFVGLALVYYGLGEAITGQTLGKRLVGLRVQRLDGGRAGVGAIVARTLLRAIDGQLFYAVALVAVLLSGERRQRIGDLVAGTTVARAR